METATLLIAVGLGLTLLALARADLAARVLPDRLTLPLAAAGLAVAAWGSGLPLHDHLFGAGAGYALFWLAGEAHFRWRGREGLGLGDAKLFAAAGAWLGWAALPAVLLAASLLGLAQAGAMRLAGAGGRELPFGPALAAAFWLTWVFGAPGLGAPWRP